MKAFVKVMPRQVILDTQGRAVGQVLNKGGIPAKDCRVGKWIELTFESTRPEEVMQLAQEAAKKTLVNPLIEEFEIILETQKG